MLIPSANLAQAAAASELFAVRVGGPGGGRRAVRKGFGPCTHPALGSLPIRFRPEGIGPRGLSWHGGSGLFAPHVVVGLVGLGSGVMGWPGPRSERTGPMQLLARWAYRTSVWRSAPSGSATRHRWPRTRRSRGGSSPAAASTNTGSAATVTCSGNSWEPWASTRAWATESSPPVSAAAVTASGPRNKARAVRTLLAAAPAPSRNRIRSQAAVEGAWVPWSAPAAPRPSTAASCWSQ